MECLRGMFYVDCILYMYISNTINRYSVEKSRKTETGDASIRQNLKEERYGTDSEYFSSMINSIKYKLEADGCELEEEMLLKYVLFLVHNNILANFFAADVNRKFYKVFDYLKNMPGDKATPLKRIVIWGYKLLLMKSKNKKWCKYASLNTKECAEKIEQIIEQAQDNDKLVNTEIRTKYFNEVKENLMEETKQIYNHLNIPILAIKEQQEIENKAKNLIVDTIQEFSDFKGILMGMDKLLWSKREDINRNNNDENELEDADKSLRATDIDLIKRKEHAHIKSMFKEKYKSIQIKSLLNSEVKGVEIKWNESGIEEEKDRKKTSEELSKKKAKQERADQSLGWSAEKLKAPQGTKRKKKVWSILDTETLIEAISKHGKAWDIVWQVCNFEDTTKEQIIEKYKSLIKSNRIARISK